MFPAASAVHRQQILHIRGILLSEEWGEVWGPDQLRIGDVEVKARWFSAPLWASAGLCVTTAAAPNGAARPPRAVTPQPTGSDVCGAAAGRPAGSAHRGRSPGVAPPQGGDQHVACSWGLSAQPRESPVFSTHYFLGPPAPRSSRLKLAPPLDGLSADGEGSGKPRSPWPRETGEDGIPCRALHPGRAQTAFPGAGLVG